MFFVKSLIYLIPSAKRSLRTILFGSYILTKGKSYILVGLKRCFLENLHTNYGDKKTMQFRISNLVIHYIRSRCIYLLDRLS